MIKQRIYFRIAILITVSILGASCLPVLTKIKTATRTQPDSTKISRCTEINIELYIRRAKDGYSSAFNQLVACDSKAIPYLIEALEDKDKNFRLISIAALGEIGANAESALPDLTKLLGKSDHDIRVIALDAFLKISDNPVSFLIDSLKDENNKYIRNGSAYALGEIGAKAESAIPALIAALRNEEKPIRNPAFHAIIKIAIENKSLVPILITALKDKDEYVRSHATYALGNIGLEAVPALIIALKDQDINVRRSAANALEKIGIEAKSAVPALIIALKDRDEDIRKSAANALGKIGVEAVPDLIIALKDQDINVRRSAANALGNIGVEAKSAVPALIIALKDKNVRKSAANALGNIGTEAVPALIIALKDQDQNVRKSAADALGNIGVEAKSAVPALITALKDQDEYVRYSAADALGNIGTEAVPALITALQDKDVDVNLSAAGALAKIGGNTTEFIPFLIPHLKSLNSCENYQLGRARDILLKIGKEAVPYMTDVLNHENWKVRLNATLILMDIGNPAKDAVPQLTEVFLDIYERKENRYLAIEALKSINSDEAISVLDKHRDIVKNLSLLGKIAYKNPRQYLRAPKCFIALIPIVRNETAEYLNNKQPPLICHVPVVNNLFSRSKCSK